MDKDGSGTISFAEWKASKEFLLKKGGIDSPKNLEDEGDGFSEGFRRFDTDGSDAMSLEHFEEALAYFGWKPPNQRAERGKGRDSLLTLDEVHGLADTPSGESAKGKEASSPLEKLNNREKRSSMMKHTAYGAVATQHGEVNKKKLSTWSSMLHAAKTSASQIRKRFGKSTEVDFPKPEKENENQTVVEEVEEKVTVISPEQLETLMQQLDIRAQQDGRSRRIARFFAVCGMDPLSGSLEPKLLQQFPENSAEHKGKAVRPFGTMDPRIMMFAFPHKIEVSVDWWNDKKSPPSSPGAHRSNAVPEEPMNCARFHTFVFTDGERNHIYAGCLKFQEEYVCPPAAEEVVRNLAHIKDANRSAASEQDKILLFNDIETIIVASKKEGLWQEIEMENVYETIIKVLQDVKDGNSSRLTLGLQVEDENEIEPVSVIDLVDYIIGQIVKGVAPLQTAELQGRGKRKDLRGNGGAESLGGKSSMHHYKIGYKEKNNSSQMTTESNKREKNNSLRNETTESNNREKDTEHVENEVYYHSILIEKAICLVSEIPFHNLFEGLLRDLHYFIFERKEEDDEEKSKKRKELQEKKRRSRRPSFIPENWVFDDGTGRWRNPQLMSKRVKLMTPKRTKYHQRETSLEDAVLRILFQIPLPRPGCMRLHFRIRPSGPLHGLRLPGLNEPPLCDHDMSTLFQTLSISDVIKLISLAIVEAPILLISDSLQTLGNVAATIVALLFPFDWQCPYIPILPYRLRGFVHAPTPYLVGLQPWHLPEDFKKGMYGDTVVAYIDDGLLYVPEQFENVSIFPKSIASTLASTIHESAYRGNFDVEKTRKGFVTALATLFQGFEKFLLEDWESQPYEEQFNTDGFAGFLQSRFPHLHDEIVQRIVETQMLGAFADSQIHPSEESLFKSMYFHSITGSIPPIQGGRLYYPRNIEYSSFTEDTSQHTGGTSVSGTYGSNPEDTIVLPDFLAERNTTSDNSIQKKTKHQKRRSRFYEAVPLAAPLWNPTLGWPMLDWGKMKDPQSVSWITLLDTMQYPKRKKARQGGFNEGKSKELVVESRQHDRDTYDRLLEGLGYSLYIEDFILQRQFDFALWAAEKSIREFGAFRKLVEGIIDAMDKSSHLLDKTRKDSVGLEAKSASRLMTLADWEPSPVLQEHIWQHKGAYQDDWMTAFYVLFQSLQLEVLLPLSAELIQLENHVDVCKRSKRSLLERVMLQKAAVEKTTRACTEGRKKLLDAKKKVAGVEDSPTGTRWWETAARNNLRKRQNRLHQLSEAEETWLEAGMKQSMAIAQLGEGLPLFRTQTQYLLRRLRAAEESRLRCMQNITKSMSKSFQNFVDIIENAENFCHTHIRNREVDEKQFSEVIFPKGMNAGETYEVSCRVPGILEPITVSLSLPEGIAEGESFNIELPPPPMLDDSLVVPIPEDQKEATDHFEVFLSNGRGSQFVDKTVGIAAGIMVKATAVAHKNLVELLQNVNEIIPRDCAYNEKEEDFQNAENSKEEDGVKETVHQANINARLLRNAIHLTQDLSHALLGFSKGHQEMQTASATWASRVGAEAEKCKPIWDRHDHDIGVLKGELRNTEVLLRKNRKKAEILTKKLENIQAALQTDPETTSYASGRPLCVTLRASSVERCRISWKSNSRVWGYTGSNCYIKKLDDERWSRFGLREGMLILTVAAVPVIGKHHDEIIRMIDQRMRSYSAVEIAFGSELMGKLQKVSKDLEEAKVECSRVEGMLRMRTTRLNETKAAFAEFRKNTLEEFREMHNERVRSIWLARQDLSDSNADLLCNLGKTMDRCKGAIPSDSDVTAQLQLYLAVQKEVAHEVEQYFSGPFLSRLLSEKKLPKTEPFSYESCLQSRCSVITTAFNNFSKVLRRLGSGAQTICDSEEAAAEQSRELTLSFPDVTDGLWTEGAEVHLLRLMRDIQRGWKVTAQSSAYDFRIATDLFQVRLSRQSRDLVPALNRITENAKRNRTSTKEEMNAALESLTKCANECASIDTQWQREQETSRVMLRERARTSSEGIFEESDRKRNSDILKKLARKQSYEWKKVLKTNRERVKAHNQLEIMQVKVEETTHMSESAESAYTQGMGVLLSLMRQEQIVQHGVLLRGIMSMVSACQPWTNNTDGIEDTIQNVKNAFGSNKTLHDTCSHLLEYKDVKRRASEFFDEKIKNGFERGVETLQKLQEGLKNLHVWWSKWAKVVRNHSQSWSGARFIAPPQDWFRGQSCTLIVEGWKNYKRMRCGELERSAETIQHISDFLQNDVTQLSEAEEKMLSFKEQALLADSHSNDTFHQSAGWVADEFEKALKKHREILKCLLELLEKLHQNEMKNKDRIAEFAEQVKHSENEIERDIDAWAKSVSGDNVTADQRL
eukprot:g1222.t1